MYALDIKPEADKIFAKLAKKNPKQAWVIHKKLTEVRENPHHRYKNLRSPLQQFKRVHIDNHFVVIFRIDSEKELVEVWYYDHHDYVYAWRPKNLD